MNNHVHVADDVRPYIVREPQLRVSYVHVEVLQSLCGPGSYALLRGWLKMAETIKEPYLFDAVFAQECANEKGT